MSLGKKKFEKLLKMQELSTQVEDDNARLAGLLQELKDAGKRHEELHELYDRDWMELAGSPDLTDDQVAALERDPSNQRYSILAEDTIWNALSDQYDLKIRILKAVAKRL